MVYAIMISLESGTFSQDSFHEGPVDPTTRETILAMLRSTLLTCERLGGPPAHRLDFFRFRVTVQRVVGSTPGHVDTVLVKPDGVFAKVEIPPEEEDGAMSPAGLKIIESPNNG